MSFDVLSGRIWGIDSGFGGPERTAAYVLRNEFGWHLIDCAAASATPRILAKLKLLGVERLTSILPTHAHLDHAGGAGTIAAAFPEAVVVAHPRAARHLADPAKLIAGTRAVWGAERFDANYGETIPVRPEQLVVAELGEAQLGLRFLDAPGHARHHYMVWDEESRTLLAGDAFGISYGGGPSFPSTSPVQFDPEAMRQTWQRILDLQPVRIAIAHYGLVSDIPERAGQLSKFLDQFVDMAQLGEVATEELLELVGEDSYRIDAELNAAGLNHWFASQNSVYSESS